MKILHAAETIKGGVASYFDEIIPYQIDRYGTDAVQALVPDAHADQLARTPATNVKTFTRNKRGLSATFAFGRALLKEVKSFQPDILHLHSSFAGFIGRLLVPFMNPRPKIVYCAHCWEFTMDNCLWKKQVYGIIETALSYITDRIINISQHEFNVAIHFGVPEKKMVTIHSGIRPMMDSPPPKQIVYGEKKSFLFVGRFDCQKGFDLLLSALAHLPDPDFTVRAIGTSVSDKKTNPIVPPYVTIMDWQARSDITHFYRDADALIMPSRWEGFGLVALEAMSCGTPVLASRRGALPEIVSSGQTGLFFDPDDSRGLAELLRQVSREELASMGLEAADDMRKRFSAERMNKQLASEYESLKKVH